MRTFLSLLISSALFLTGPTIHYTSPPPEDNTESASKTSSALNVQAPSALLMEASSGTVIYEKDSHTLLHPASITKIMTLLLIMEALENGSIALTDTVTVSEYAASMGGSQVFLEAGETQSVQDMVKCISIASANDASVAMAEHISGSEAVFVEAMNQRAAELGMNDTTFINCCGLDTEGHMTTAYDVALMSRELIVNHPEIHDYCTIWMDTITHNTARGASEFGLTNTNKLIRQYEYATGLKTGSTDEAKFCVSATAKKNDLELIAVIMAAPDHKVRFADAVTLLNYGFSHCTLYQDANTDTLPAVFVRRGIETEVSLSYEGPFQYVSTTGEDTSSITKELSLPEEVSAPIEEGTPAGMASYLLNGKEIGTVPILYSNSVPAASYQDYLARVSLLFFSVL